MYSFLIKNKCQLISNHISSNNAAVCSSPMDGVYSQ